LAAIEEAQLTRLVQRTIGRRKIDASRMQIKAAHGVVYLRGYVSRLRGHDFDLREEMEIIRKLLRGTAGIREVHMEDLVIRQ
jgi:hypothetical protein